MQAQFPSMRFFDRITTFARASHRSKDRRVALILPIATLALAVASPAGANQTNDAETVVFELFDAETGNPVQDAAILFKISERYWVSEYPYETNADYVAYRVFENGELAYRKRTLSVLDDAHILVLGRGYEPVKFQLPEKLERGKPLTKRIEMTPLPDLELSIVTPDGSPASDVTVTEIRPDDFREMFYRNGSRNVLGLLKIEQTSDAKGSLRIRFPAYSDWATYRITHPSGYAYLNLKDVPKDTDDASVIRQPIQLAEYATVRGKYLPGISENEHLEVCRLKKNRISVDGPRVLVELDENGRFELEPQLAGWYSFVHRIRFKDEKGRGHSSAVALHGPFQVKNGEIVDLELGSDGHEAVGRVVMPDGSTPVNQFFEVTVQSGPFPGRPHMPTDIEDESEQFAWWDSYWKSDEGRQYRYFNRRYGSTAVSSDGHFRFPMLRPGVYKLFLNHRAGNKLTLQPFEFEVAAQPGDQPLDLGILQLQ